MTNRMDRPIAPRRPHALAVLALLAGCLPCRRPAGLLRWRRPSGGSLGHRRLAELRRVHRHRHDADRDGEQRRRAVSTSGNGISLTTRASAILRNGLSFTGSAPSAPARRSRSSAPATRPTGSWAPTTHATVAADGSFSAVWHTNHIGRFAIRAVVGSSASAQRPSSRRRSRSPSTARRSPPFTAPASTATRRPAAQKLTPSHDRARQPHAEVRDPGRHLLAGRTLVVPVIDRGPTPTTPTGT